MKVPFCLPYIDNDVKKEVNDVLTNTGWLTSGPKVFALEKEISKISGSKNIICTNSWTSGAMLIMKWYGIGYGDEVIIPSYTYAATALSVLNIGAKPIMVEVCNDFTIDPAEINKVISNKTKAILPVDIGGWPCDYDSINRIVKSKKNKKKFNPKGEKQKILKRILVIADAAHSIGGFYKGNPVGRLCDITIFSFHSVKNITTGEGGAICLNLPKSFNNLSEHKFIKYLSLNGQTKSAFDKNQSGSWKYDIIAQGLKVNMPDICAAIGLAQIRKYNSKLLSERKKIFEFYNNFFRDFDWAIIPNFKNKSRESSYHLYMLRIKGIDETDRDQLIQFISDKSVGVNVHYIPMPMLTLFKNLGYNINKFPKTHELYSNEISLPVYNNLNTSQLNLVCNSVKESFNKLFSNK